MSSSSERYCVHISCSGVYSHCFRFGAAAYEGSLSMFGDS